MEGQEQIFERHYSVEELATLWQVSDDLVRRLYCGCQSPTRERSTGAPRFPRL